MRVAAAFLIALGFHSIKAPPSAAQVPVESEVRQIVTFSFLPGKAAEAIEAYSGQAIPLYEQDDAMLSFRAFREVESPVSLDLMVISAFRGMAGMDQSNSRLRELAAAAGTSIGAIYGGIGGASTGHTDQFVEMLPALGSGDPSSTRLTALVWYRIVPGEADAFENALRMTLRSDDGSPQPPSATGRFLVADGWDYLRFLGFESLGEYQRFWSSAAASPGHVRIASLTSERREVIVAAMPDLSVREEQQ